ncbi:MAG: DNA translocase FtsK, partial [Deltaproteobacteria bacterium]|nr:DNA translocase FtsK [Deltaproteobacteria bacterium]
QTILKEPPKEEEISDTTEYDERYDDAVALITKTGQASISMIQRHLRIGYNRAARIIETMEKEGIVGPSDGAKPREVLVKGYQDIP